jgi:hypothetical protein
MAAGKGGREEGVQGFQEKGHAMKEMCVIVAAVDESTFRLSGSSQDFKFAHRRRVAGAIRA